MNREHSIPLGPKEVALLRSTPGISVKDAILEVGFTSSRISLEESRFLTELIQCLTAPGPIIEIGTLFGWSTLVMALAKTSSRQIVTVDSYTWNPVGLSPESHYRLTQSVLREAVEKFNVQQVRMDKDSFYTVWQGPAPSLVFLDAVHDYEPTRADLEWARQFPAATVCGHDYSRQFPGVVQAVDELGGPRELVQSLFVL